MDSFYRMCVCTHAIYMYNQLATLSPLAKIDYKNKVTVLVKYNVATHLISSANNTSDQWKHGIVATRIELKTITD